MNGELTLDECPLLVSGGMLAIRATVVGSCNALQVSGGATLMLSPFVRSRIGIPIQILRDGLFIENGHGFAVVGSWVESAGIVLITGDADVHFDGMVCAASVPLQASRPRSL